MIHNSPLLLNIKYRDPSDAGRGCERGSGPVRHLFSTSLPLLLQSPERGSADFAKVTVLSLGPASIYPLARIYLLRLGTYALSPLSSILTMDELVWCAKCKQQRDADLFELNRLGKAYSTCRICRVRPSSPSIASLTPPRIATAPYGRPWARSTPMRHGRPVTGRYRPPLYQRHVREDNGAPAQPTTTPSQPASGQRGGSRSGRLPSKSSCATALLASSPSYGPPRPTTSGP
jgi:hypothetical protein